MRTYFRSWFICTDGTTWWVERPDRWTTSHEQAFWSNARDEADARRIIDDQLEIVLGGQMSRYD